MRLGEHFVSLEWAGKEMTTSIVDDDDDNIECIAL